jgi:hypothetical protein
MTPFPRYSPHHGLSGRGRRLPNLRECYCVVWRLSGVSLSTRLELGVDRDLSLALPEPSLHRPQAPPSCLTQATCPVPGLTSHTPGPVHHRASDSPRLTCPLAGPWSTHPFRKAARLWH